MTSAGWNPSDPAINKPTVIELGVEGEELFKEKYSDYYCCRGERRDIIPVQYFV